MITYFEGFGDVVYHTPTIKAFSKFFKYLDVWCKQPEPLMHNPYIRRLTVFKNSWPESLESYGKNVFCVSVDSVLHIPHCRIHTVDLVSLKTLGFILRDSEKTLEAYWSQEDTERVRSLLYKHPLAEQNKIQEGKFVVISPARTWQSRTLPLDFYIKLISAIQTLGYGVVLVGKDIVYPSGVDCNKTLYPSRHFPGAIALYNQLTFAELCALYSFAPVAINTENGNNPISCTNDTCWNLYIPTLTAPEYRLPHRKGSQQYRTAVAGNSAQYYPASVYGDTGMHRYDLMPVCVPSVEEVMAVFRSILDQIRDEKNILLTKT